MPKSNTGLPALTKKEQRIVNVFLKCKVTEEGKSRKIILADCFDAFALGKALGQPKLQRQNAEYRKALESAKEQMQEAGLYNGLVAAACAKKQ